MSDQNYSFGEYIRFLRKSKDISLKDAAKSMGMSSQLLCDFEAGRKGKRYVSIEMVRKVSTAYGVPIAEIIKATEAAVSNERSLSDVMREMIPAIRLAELLSKKMMDMSSQYSKEIEDTATELNTYIQNIRILTNILNKKQVNTIEEKKSMRKPSPCLEPDKMNGAGDIFPGSDYD